MRNFSVGKEVLTKRDINVGIAPGKFDTKQLILSAIAVLAAEANGGMVRFVRTVNMEQLSNCVLFINDDFTTMFPVIPSYHDIATAWNKNAASILKKYSVYDDDGKDFVNSSVIEKICNLEAIDCIMQLYKTDNYSYIDSFEEALNVTLGFIDKFIADSVKDRMFFLTVKAYVNEAEVNYLKLPVYVQGWRHILSLLPNAESIDYVIFPDEENTFVVEAKDKEMSVKKYVKGLKGITYSGRFFVRVNDIDVAEKVVSKLPKRKNLNQKTA